MSFWFYYMVSLLRRGLFVSQGGWVKKKEARGARREPTWFPGSLFYPLSRSVATGRREPWERGWPRAFYFSIIAVFIGIPSGSLCGGESHMAVSSREQDKANPEIWLATRVGITGYIVRLGSPVPSISRLALNISVSRECLETPLNPWGNERKLFKILLHSNGYMVGKSPKTV